MRVTRPGQRHKAAAAISQVDSKGRPVYWIGPVGAPDDDSGPGTDFRAMTEAFVWVAPLQMDLTACGTRETLAQWLGT